MDNITNTRIKILENARGLIEAEGLKGLTIQRLIEKCGIGKTTFYRFFPTKKELLLQLKHFGNSNNTRIYSLKDQIAEIAREGFSRYGYNGIDMDSVARAARLNRVTLYRYFSNKDELLEYCIQSEFNKVKELLTMHMKKQGDPETALVQYFDFLNIFLKTSRNNSLISESWNQIFRNNRIKALTADLSRFFLNTFIGILEEGKQMGLFRSNFDTSVYAGIIIMLQNGFMFTMTFEPEFNSAETIMNAILNMILKELKQ